MITNERQHRITAAAIRRFEQAIGHAEHDGPAPGVDSRLHDAMIDGMSSQLSDLRADLAEYEALRDGKVKRRQLESLLEVPQALIEGRIARKLTQKELGRKLGVPEQQVQRYEQTRYSGVGIERLQQVAEALGIKLVETVEYDVRAPRRRQTVSSRRGRGAPRATTKSRPTGLQGGAQGASRTSRAAASAAGKRLASKSSRKTARKGAASDLAQVGNRKATGKKGASAVARAASNKSSKTSQKDSRA